MSVREYILFILLASLSASHLRCTNNKIAGTTDETELEVIALSGNLVQGTNGNPAVNARVLLYSSNNSIPQAAIDSFSTTAEGSYRFKYLKPGTYSISAELLSSSDSLYGTRRNIVIKKSVNIGTDTLKAPGYITGKVRVANQGSKSNIFCFIPGTSYLSITDTGGNYAIYHIPPGTYNLAFWHQKYNDSSIADVTVVPEKETRAPDMMLHLVTNLQTKNIYGSFTTHYDSISECEAFLFKNSLYSNTSMVFPLDWNPVSHSYSGYVTLPDTGTYWAATIITYDTHARKTGIGSVTFTKLASNILVPSFDPTNAVPRLDAGKDIIASLHDTVHFYGTATDSFGGSIIQYKWDFNNDGICEDSSLVNDTVRWVYDSLGIQRAVFYACDNDGNIGTDTVKVIIPDFIPVVKIVKPSKDATFCDTLALVKLFAHAVDSFGGYLTKFEWDFNGDGIWDTALAKNDTVAHLFPMGTYKTLFAATDNDGNKSVDSCRITVSCVVQVSAGSDYSFFVKKDRSVWGSGNPNEGKLGNGSGWPQIYIPVKLSEHVLVSSAGFRHSGFIKDDASSWTTGYNDDGELGNGISGWNAQELIPVRVANDVAQIVTGEDATLFLKTDKSVWACGRNDYYGQLGLGASVPGSVIPAFIMNDVIAISAGKSHSCAIKADQSYWAWGCNQSGQVGNGKSGYNEKEFMPLKIADNVIAVDAGWDYTMFIKSDKSLWGCGSNTVGQLGNGKSGTTEIEAVPVKITDNVYAVSAGKGHTMFIKTDFTLWACGDNTNGQFGNGTTVPSAFPIKITDNVASVSIGADYSLIIKKDGSAWAAGLNSSGQLGDGTKVNRQTWVQVLNK